MTSNCLLFLTYQTQKELTRWFSHLFPPYTINSGTNSLLLQCRGRRSERLHNISILNCQGQIIGARRIPSFWKISLSGLPVGNYVKKLDEEYSSYRWRSLGLKINARRTCTYVGALRVGTRQQWFFFFVLLVIWEERHG